MGEGGRGQPVGASSLPARSLNYVGSTHLLLLKVSPTVAHRKSWRDSLQQRHDYTTIYILKLLGLEQFLKSRRTDFGPQTPGEVVISPFRFQREIEEIIAVEGW